MFTNLTNHKHAKKKFLFKLFCYPRYNSLFLHVQYALIIIIIIFLLRKRLFSFVDAIKKLNPWPIFLSYIFSYHSELRFFCNGMEIHIYVYILYVFRKKRIVLFLFIYILLSRVIAECYPFFFFTID